MNRRNGVLKIMLWFFCSLFGLGSSLVWAEAQSQVNRPDYYFDRIAVAPILIGHRQPNIDETLDDTLSCPINQICIDDPSIQSNAGSMLLRLVQSMLKRRFGENVVPLESVQDAYAGLRLDGTKDSPRTLAHRMGESLSADLMVVGTVWRYRDRGSVDGFPDKPASVAFAVYLVEPISGRLLWRGVFDQAQEFALDDMANFKRRMKMGFKWLTADELARHGVKQVFQPFPANIKPLAKRYSE